MDIDEEFNIDPAISYLNHAAVAPWPLRASRAVTAFAEENARRGAQHYPGWLTVETALREQLASLINAPASGDIALVKNTSEALSFVAYGLHWQSGDEIIITTQEFPSNRIVWESLADKGVTVTQVDLDTAESGEAALINAFSARTRLVAISSVQYGTGYRLDLQQLGEACRAANVLFCVDAIQSIGALPIDVQAMQIDFTMADGHKWLLGPEGLGLFYVRPELRDQLALTEYGWHMIENRGDFQQHQWQVASDATRFECGSPNLLAAHALHASVGLLLEVGMEVVADQIHERVDYLADRLYCLAGVYLISSRDRDRQSGILTFSVTDHDPQDLYQALMERNVICACRGGGVRFSPHFYTPFSALDKAVAEVEQLI